MRHKQAALEGAQPVDEVYWQAILQRDTRADVFFVFTRMGAGRYCRPSCPLPSPLRQQVEVFDLPQQAEAAGFSACEHCQPQRLQRERARAQRIVDACRQIQSSETMPDLDGLALQAGMSRYHFQRVFKALVGLSPYAFATAQRARRTREQLQEGEPITQALYEAGFNSLGRFYANRCAVLGMTPSRFRAKGQGETLRFALGQSRLGAILVAASARGICAIFLGDNPEVLLMQLQEAFADAELIGGDAHFEAWVATVVGFVENPASALPLPLDIRGTVFQQRVWQALREIPVGQTLSYSELAARLGQPGSARAVASACAANVLAVAIPCHRVVRQDGSLSGYRWGIARKRALLDQESAE